MTIGTFDDELEAALRYDDQAGRLGKPVNFPEEGTLQKKAMKWGSASAAARRPPGRGARAPADRAFKSPLDTGS